MRLGRLLPLQRPAPPPESGSCFARSEHGPILDFVTASATATPLPPLTEADDRPVLRQGSTAPLFRGDTSEGMDYTCAHCQASLLLERVGPTQLWNVALECGSCGGLSACPPWPPGIPLPQLRVVAGPRTYRLEGTVELHPGSVFAAEDASTHPVSMKGFPLKGSAHLSRQFCVDLVERVQAVLGNVYASLRETDRRGQASSTPPAHRHRLMELVEDVLAAAESLATDESPSVDARSLVELRLTADLFEQWSDDPAWPGFLASLKNRTDFPHALATLAAASFLNEAGNHSGLNIAEHGRAPDLRLQISADEYVGCEVKTPLPLQRPPTPLTADEADRIVRKALTSARTQAGGQLSPNRSGCLVVVGFHLHEPDAEVLERAAARLLASRGRAHVIAIVVMGLGVVLEETDMSRSLSGGVTLRLAANPSYAGAHRLVDEPSSALRAVRVDD